MKRLLALLGFVGCDPEVNSDRTIGSGKTAPQRPKGRFMTGNGEERPRTVCGHSCRLPKARRKVSSIIAPVRRRILAVRCCSDVQWIILSSVFSHGTLRLLGNPRFMAGPRALSDPDPRDQLATLIQIIAP